MNWEQFESNIDYWTYAKHSHWEYFGDLDVELYNRSISKDSTRLKSYQDLLVMMVIKNFIPVGSRLLEVGGGSSRILRYFSKTHECWNVDKFEGLGNGPTEIQKSPYKVVIDYMGNFNQEIPENYFDFIFSISALEHVTNENQFAPICDDINRCLRDGGLSVHLLDIIFRPNGGFWSNNIAYYMFESLATINTFIPVKEMVNDKDLYCMSEEAYNSLWKRYTGKNYEEHGRPSSLNVFWSK